ncbi:flagellar protein FlgJ [Natronospira proteinivora]|uniref:Peptidoglycan hydrolase FlgJ n=1 Tax=Natronospira proteinivora TaxID=1807133 RepID=A0ABT1G549_9GAMM|nr:flagellar assembly peptidoglycan hydrolase FlgJ [Natronospira proteinivora]MCP1726422.1 flagellar protein FlgJ [Natronospira proteinivora]
MVSGEQPIFTDLQGLEKLRGMARRDDPEALQAVAQQFESLFTHMMLQSMRSAGFGDDLTGGNEMEFYRDMFDQQIAVEMSQGEGLGLADMIVRDLGGDPGAPAGMRPGESSVEALRRRAIPVRETGESVPRLDESTGPGQGAAANGASAESDEDFEPNGPREFLERLMPAARGAARRLGVEPQLVLAQAALETGWGQHMIRDGEGRNSFNLFGIKASRDWEGPEVTVPTLEFEEGLPVRRHDQFRAYQSPEDSLEDYVRLLETSPRYQQALGQGDDAAAFGQALQAGGYATDPQYAEKIQRVAESAPMQDLLNGSQGNDFRGQQDSGTDGLKNMPFRPYE